ncbi:MAG TPA: alpha,alpha-trehalase TreA [Steroidobacteraceae bacterium]|jgi:alpha,alpha-trehalase|nr:alpha,alpha-trehalase TreA [Steroidobacteraceae bacterium]
MNRKLLSCAWALLWMGAALAAPAPTPQPPSVVYGDLFDTVQRQKVFVDSKTFADAVPKDSPAGIMAAWRQEKRGAGFDLRAFVERHFTVPEVRESTYRSRAGEDVCAHIASLWPVLTRQPDAPVAGSSLLPLPHRYVVPGGRFQEIYYWDSYFTMLGLEAPERRALATDMLANFAHLIDTYGHIPNGNRTYYLSRSQPPFFAAMVSRAATRDGDEVYTKFLPQLLREHEFWMEGADGLAPGSAHRRVVRLRNGTVLNRYWDDRATPRDEAYREDIATAAASKRPAAEVYRNLRAAAESGWDFSSRWLADGHSLATIRTVDILPVDLNSLMYELERVIARVLSIKDDPDAKRWETLADQRAQAIRAVFWNEQRHTYTDYLWRESRLANSATLAALYPLYFGVAEAEQAHQVASTLRVTLLRPEGVVPTPVVSGEQWDAPNGWAPLVWLTIEGLRRYDEADLADFIARGWRRENVEVFRRTGKLTEKYDVTGNADARGGEYPNQDGFGWTNGVLWQLECTPDP